MVHSTRTQNEETKQTKKVAKSVFRNRIERVLADVEEIEEQRAELMRTSMVDITTKMLEKASLTNFKVEAETLAMRVKSLETRLQEALAENSDLRKKKSFLKLTKSELEERMTDLTMKIELLQDKIKVM